MTAPDTIVVVGGGIGGVSAAVALAKRGMEVTVLERAPEIKEIGAGLQLGPNAGRVLQDLGVMDAVLRTAVLPHRFVLRDIYTGNEIYQATMGKEFVQRYGAPYTVIHRADLLDALLEVALATGNVEVVTGKEVVAVEQTDTAAHVRCADGSTYRGDAVIGADGLRSAVRRLTLDDSEPIRSEYVIYRGPGPRPEGTEDAVMLFAGDEIHLMQYPVQGGELLNRVLSFRSRTATPGSEEWATREELFERFANTCDHIKESLHTLDLETRWVQFDRKPMAGWSDGRITLLGDAAHPMRQYLAQGAGQAMEDAVALADALGSGAADVPAALAKYEEIRYPRTSAVQENTRFFGEMVHLGGAGAILRDAYLGTLADNDYSLAQWLYGTDGVAPPRVPGHMDIYSKS
ncbi:FAD-dependent oxidoreductase [Streptomyces sp. NPDC005774]|uniref:FAD-dependent oxidoreductase n=1 Tax=Streptomyces sp. NPDC005774 TaxID=3364728 RepID=UPI0036B47CF2